MDDPEFATGVLDRLAYGIAAARVEASRFDTLDGRRDWAQGDAAEAIEAEVLVGRVGATDPTARGTIRQAIADDAGRTAAALVGPGEARPVAPPLLSMSGRSV